MWADGVLLELRLKECCNPCTVPCQHIDHINVKDTRIQAIDWTLSLDGFKKHMRIELILPINQVLYSYKRELLLIDYELMELHLNAGCPCSLCKVSKQWRRLLTC